MNLPLLNRSADGQFQPPVDGWYHLAPKGEFAHPETGWSQVIDERALHSIVQRFRQEAARPNFTGLLVDFEHFSYDPGKSSEAAGWIQDLDGRPDGLWGAIRWSDVGESAIRNGRYRLVSPTWTARDVERLDERRIRPLRLDSAGLTNNPNLKGMVPLSNRQPALILAADHGVPPGFPAANLPRTGAGDTTPTQGNMKPLYLALGLSAEASEEAALAEVTKLKNRAAAAEAELAPLRNRNAELEASAAELLGAQVEHDLARFAPRFKPEARDKWRAALLANRAGALELLESLAIGAGPGASASRADWTRPGAPVTGVSGGAGRSPIHNRAEAVPPNGDFLAGVGARPGEHPFLNRARELAEKRQCGLPEAIMQLARSEPAAYRDYALAINGLAATN